MGKRPRIIIATVAAGDSLTPGARYSAAVEGSGGTAFFCGLMYPEDAAAAARDFDGLLLAGGGDCAPWLYGGAYSRELECSPPERDISEMWLAGEFLQRGKALLAVCRGVQMLNVALGGTLRAHVCGHSGGGRHSIGIEGGSLLAGLIGTEAEVCSAHHQAIGRPGRGVVPIARAPDGVIEAVAIAGRKNALGVQFHPERTLGEGMRPIFDWFVAQSAR